MITSQTDPTTTKLTEISMRLNDLQRSIGRLRRARFVGLVLILLLGGALGAAGVGATYWKDYQAAKRAQSFVRCIRSAGLNVVIDTSEDGSHVITVSGESGTYLGGTKSADATGAVLRFRGIEK